MLEGEFVFLTKKVSEIAREEKAARLVKRARGRPRNKLIVRAILEEEDEVSVYLSTTLEDELA
jgi:DNA-binding PucR family transcriptional regulator